MSDRITPSGKFDDNWRQYIKLDAETIGLIAKLTAINTTLTNQLNITLTELRDALRGVDSKTLSDVVSKLNELLTELQDKLEVTQLDVDASKRLGVRIETDNAGLVKESGGNVEKLKRGRIMSDYEIITVDLSTERSDELLASNVQGLVVLSADAGATFSIKLFDKNHDAITETDLAALNNMIADIEPCDVYISNSAQSGLTVRFFIAKG